MKFAIIIPASMGSKRLPGKPLVLIGDQTMLERVIEAARKTNAENVLVATTDDIIQNICIGNIDHYQSKQKHKSGTSRCAEAVKAIDPSIDLIVNWQVDEPFLSPGDVLDMVNMVSSWAPEEQATTIGTIVGPGGGDACPHCSYGHIQRGGGSGPCTECYGGHSKHVVKVARGIAGNRCYWFSRAPMSSACNHIGVYCYHRNLLEKLALVKESYPSQQEHLEQLDWLVAGYKIQASFAGVGPRSINTHWDYEQALKGLPS